MIITPVFMIFKLTIALSTRKPVLNFISFPLFLYGIPMTFLIPLTNLMKSYSLEDFELISDYLIYGLPICVCYWLFLSLFGIQKRFKF